MRNVAPNRMMAARAPSRARPDFRFVRFSFSFPAGGRIRGPNAKEEAAAASSPSVFLFFLFTDSHDLAAVVLTAGPAYPVGQMVSAAAGAGHDAGDLELPMAAAPFIAPGLGCLSLGDRHVDTSSSFRCFKQQYLVIFVQ
jgi:hypothetical protein